MMPGRWVAAMTMSIIGVVPQVARSQTVDALSLLEATAANYEHVNQFCADFTQVLSVPLLGDERTGTGQMCQARPNKFAMRFSDPEGDLVVVDQQMQVRVVHQSASSATPTASPEPPR